ncbi:hypothetical protein BTZ20_5522 [Rhodococcus sp. MTM3W5.2]|jgi:hypothetical protein|nr:hypothetical protein BTZ20_5522 [Rhodococcus sp. MTM3W5.2]
MEEFFCGFQTGWSAGAGFDGGVMVRDPEVKASADDIDDSPR